MNHQINYTYHRNLASYFTSKVLYTNESEQKGPNIRKVVEQPWQMTKAEIWDEVENTLTDFRFIEAKCISGLVYDLMQDFVHCEVTLKNLNIANKVRSENWQEWKHFLMCELESFFHYAKKFPQLVFQQTYNTEEHPNITIIAKSIELSGKAPNKPWFRLFELEYSPYVTMLKLRRPIIDAKSERYMYITSLIKLNHNIIVSGYLDGWIAVWDLDSGIRIQYFQAHSWMIHSIIKVDDRFFATGGDDGFVKLWNAVEGTVVREHNRHSDKVLSMLLWNKQYIVSGSTDKTISVWNIDNNEHNPVILTGHSDSVTKLAVAEEDILISTGMDNVIKLWKLPEGTLLHTSKKYTNAIEHNLLKSPSGKIYSMGNDNLIYWRISRTINPLDKITFWLQKGSKINPKTIIPLRGSSYVWLKEFKLLVCDNGKIIYVDIKKSVSRLLYSRELSQKSEYPFPYDMPMGVIDIGNGFAVSWGRKGLILKWDCAKLTPVAINQLPCGEATHAIKIDNRHIAIGTSVFQEIFIVDVFPEPKQIKGTNFTYVNELQDKQTDNNKENCQDRYDAIPRGALEGINISQNLSRDIPLGYNEEWNAQKRELPEDCFLEVRNHFIYYVKTQDVAVLPGSFRSCENGFDRFSTQDVHSGRMRWYELING